MTDEKSPKKVSRESARHLFLCGIVVSNSAATSRKIDDNESSVINDSELIDYILSHCDDGGRFPQVVLKDGGRRDVVDSLYYKIDDSERVELILTFPEYVSLRRQRRLKEISTYEPAFGGRKI